MTKQPWINRRPLSRAVLAAVVAVSTFCASSVGAGGPEDDRLHTWNQEERALLRSLWIGSLPPLPLDPSNAYAADPKAQKLGERLFYDPRFSQNGQVACATCHEREYQFTEDMPRARGIGATARRTPPLIGVAYNTWFFWDGRADSLWAQALGPLENPNEHGITRTFCAQTIEKFYKREYEEIFGPLPQFPREVCDPAAKPDPEDQSAVKGWRALPPSKAEEINRVYANMGKAIAAYERLIVPGPARFDRYVEALLAGDREGMRHTLDQLEVKGLRLFIGRANCIACHPGPLLTDGEFRRAGVYQPTELPPDRGRADGIKKVLASEYNCRGRYSDAQEEGECRKLQDLAAGDPSLIEAFKVPTLRNVAERAPYMHAGQYWSLWEVLRFFGKKDPSPGLRPYLPPGGLTEEEMAGLTAFLRTLSGPLRYPGSDDAKGVSRHHLHGK